MMTTDEDRTAAASIEQENKNKTQTANNQIQNNMSHYRGNKGLETHPLAGYRLTAFVRGNRLPHSCDPLCNGNQY